MITIEQLDELEGRILRALELIGDLRSENSRLESENEALRKEHYELKLALRKLWDVLVIPNGVINFRPLSLGDMFSSHPPTLRRRNNVMGTCEQIFFSF